MAESQHCSSIPRANLTEKIVKRIVSPINGSRIKPGDKLPTGRELTEAQHLVEVELAGSAAEDGRGRAAARTVLGRSSEGPIVPRDGATLESPRARRRCRDPAGGVGVRG